MLNDILRYPVAGGNPAVKHKPPTDCGVSSMFVAQRGGGRGVARQLGDRNIHFLAPPLPHNATAAAYRATAQPRAQATRKKKLRYLLLYILFGVSGTLGTDRSTEIL